MSLLWMPSSIFLWVLTFSIWTIRSALESIHGQRGNMEDYFPAVLATRAIIPNPKGEGWQACSQYQGNIVYYISWYKLCNILFYYTSPWLWEWDCKEKVRPISSVIWIGQRIGMISSLIFMRCNKSLFDHHLVLSILCKVLAINLLHLCWLL